jgi:hypothetical protein
MNDMKNPPITFKQIGGTDCARIWDVFRQQYACYARYDDIPLAVLASLDSTERKILRLRLDWADGNAPMTVLKLAVAMGAKIEPSEELGKELQKYGFAMIGGCMICAATIACYNAYPSKDGYWKCEDCIDNGFSSLAEYHEFCDPL